MQRRNSRRSEKRRRIAPRFLIGLAGFILLVILLPKGDNNRQESMPDFSLTVMAGRTPEVAQSVPDSDREIVASALFKDIYLPYADRTKPREYNAVLIMAKSCGYSYDVSDEPIDTIMIYENNDKNGDYVYFGFFDDSYSGLLFANTVSYYKADERKEVSLNNYSTDFNLKYDKYKTHGEYNKNVTGPVEQAMFLFG